MLYAREVIELMAAFPNRDFRMHEIIGYVRNGRDLTPRARKSMGVALFRLMRQLEGMGSVQVDRMGKRTFAVYRWKTTT